MILKLDKGDVKKVIGEFVDTAVRVELNQKFRKAFADRMEPIIEEKIRTTNFDKIIKERVNSLLDQRFKPDWSGNFKYIDDQVKAKLDQMAEGFDIKEAMNKRLTADMVEELWGHLVLVKRRPK